MRWILSNTSKNGSVSALLTLGHCQPMTYNRVQTPRTSFYCQQYNVPFALCLLSINGQRISVICPAVRTWFRALCTRGWSSSVYTNILLRSFRSLEKVINAVIHPACNHCLHCQCKKSNEITPVHENNGKGQLICILVSIYFSLCMYFSLKCAAYILI